MTVALNFKGTTEGEEIIFHKRDAFSAQLARVVNASNFGTMLTGAGRERSVSTTGPVANFTNRKIIFSLSTGSRF